MVSLLANIANEKTMIFHEINVFSDGNEADFIFLRHFFNRQGTLYYIDRSVSTL